MNSTFGRLPKQELPYNYPLILLRQQFMINSSLIAFFLLVFRRAELGAW
jgi:hypothetical protein